MNSDFPLIEQMDKELARQMLYDKEEFVHDQYEFVECSAPEYDDGAISYYIIYEKIVGDKRAYYQVEVRYFLINNTLEVDDVYESQKVIRKTSKKHSFWTTAHK